MRRAPRLYRTEEVSVALAAGVRRPMVLLPEDSEGWSEDRLRLVLLHEIAHDARRDCLALVLTAAATAVYWFHPLVWALAARMRRDGELACDDAVLASGARASDYAGELLAIFRSLRFRGAETPVALALTEGSEIEGRLRAILSPAARRGAPSRAAARGGFLAAVCATALLAALEPWSSGGGRAHAAALPTSPLELSESTAPPSLMFRAPEPARGIVFASRRNERSGRAWYSQGMDLHHEGRYARAIEAFRHAIELGYREDDASYNIACGYALSGDKDRAFEWLGKARDAGFELDHYLDRDDDLDALREDPRFAALEKSLGVDDRRARRKERLADRFDRLSGSGPHSGQGYESLGRELLDARDFDRAAKAFAEAARLGYREGTSLYNQACALSRKGDRAAALDALERSLAAGFDSPHHFDHDDDLDNLRGERRFDELDDVAHDRGPRRRRDPPPPPLQPQLVA
jgi:tetratricopeptide (TPR) repeat protein